MAGGGGDSTVMDVVMNRGLSQTPTWAVALVCAVIVLISILLEKTIHNVTQACINRKKTALVEALEKIKGELMVLGFISLILTFGQNYITRMCIPEKYGKIMLPCDVETTKQLEQEEGGHRRLLWHEHRILAADSPARKCALGTVPLISVHGLHQLHIFIFFLAIFHVMFSAITMTLGRIKTRGWKVWENEILSETESGHDHSRYRFTHEISFVKAHSSSMTMNPILFYISCFFRHIFHSVRKADYKTVRNGFISVHLAPGSKFNFQKYIKRSLEDDFKTVVGIPPFLWTMVVLFLLLNVKGWQTMFWVSMLPLVIILAVGTKLQAIITKLAVEIQHKHAVVLGTPLVQLSDEHFWFNKPQLVLNLIHLTLFQNAFDITYFIWITYEFGIHSCFHSHLKLALIRVCIGVGVQFVCSYITLPLYALVTQMGSHMKTSIFHEETSRALLNWRISAKKKVERNQTVSTDDKLSKIFMSAKADAVSNATKDNSDADNKANQTPQQVSP